MVSLKKSRYLTSTVEELCFQSHKMAFISGPRQCGKTTLAKQLLKKRGDGHYYNWDESTFRKQWVKNPTETVLDTATTQIPLFVFDEIHKAKSWKRTLKGIYDTLTNPVDILVTGSAKLNIYRRSSDSLLGRYHHFRLHPFSMAELIPLKNKPNHEKLIDTVFERNYPNCASAHSTLEQLMAFGPFPEPLFSGSKKLLRLWQRERLERLIREDLRDLSRIQELSQIEMLASLLPERAAGVLSINALREDLEVAHKTMTTWMNYLKELYYLYEIKPYTKSLPRALKKEGKLYLWDWSEIPDQGAKFENLVGSHLLKYCHFLTDSGEANMKLHYIRNKEKLEIDFLVLKNGEPWLPVEVKLHNTDLSKQWTLLKHLPCRQGIQIVLTPGVFKRYAVADKEVLVISAEYFLPLLC